jgi:ankyrin repeat protein
MFKRSFLTISLLTVLAASSAMAFEYSEEDEFTFGSTLIDAVDKNNIDLVQLALQQGTDPNQVGKFDTTALHRAALNGNIDIVNLLVISGADINFQDYGGATPLSIAARTGQVTVTKELVKNGADMNSQDAQGYTPLHRAVANRQATVSKYLIKAGANVNTVNAEGNSPLIDAVKISNTEIVTELLISGADTTIKNNKGLDVIAYALKAGNSEIDNILAQSSQGLLRASAVSGSSVVADSNIPAFLKNEMKAKNASNAVKVPVPTVEMESDIEPIAMPASMAKRKIQKPTIVPVAPVTTPDISELAVEETVKPFEITDLQFTGNSTAKENITSLQKAPRLPSEDTVVAEDKVVEKIEPQEIKSKEQNAKIQEAYKQGLENIKPIELPDDVERNPDSIKIGEDINPDNQVVYNFNYQEPEKKAEPKKVEAKKVKPEKVKAEAKKLNNMEVPASLRYFESAVSPAVQEISIETMPAQIPEAPAQPAPTILALADMETTPVDSLQVVSKDKIESVSVAPAPVATNVAPIEVEPASNSSAEYEAEVDMLLNQQATTVAIDEIYEAEVDDLIKQLVTTNQEVPSQSIMYQQAEYPLSLTIRDELMKKQTTNSDYNTEVEKLINSATQAVPVVPVYVTDQDIITNIPVARNLVVGDDDNYKNTTEFNDYNAYKNSLLQNINEFYNKDFSKGYRPYDISDLNEQRMRNLNATEKPEPQQPSDNDVPEEVQPIE